MDFFAIEVLTARNPVRYFVIDLGTRRAGRRPHGVWMKQMARNVTDAWTEFSRACATSSTTAIRSSDEFPSIPREAGVKSIKLPAQSRT